jgi:hypothetical protein
LATLYHLHEFIQLQQQQQQQTKPVKLIVLDSIAFHYRAITPTDEYQICSKGIRDVDASPNHNNNNNNNHNALSVQNQEDDDENEKENDALQEPSKQL